MPRGSLFLYTEAQIMRDFLESGIESKPGLGDHPIPLSCPHMDPSPSGKLSSRRGVCLKRPEYGHRRVDTIRGSYCGLRSVGHITTSSSISVVRVSYAV